MATRSPASTAILEISLELVAVAVFTLIAGASDEAGKGVLIIMAGFWLIYLISEAGVFANLNNVLQNLIANPTNK
jgi:hypothetical protein